MKYMMVMALVALAVPAQAASWRMVAESDLGTKMYVDDDSTVHGKDYTASWVRMIGDDGTYSTSLIAVKCDSNSFMYLKSTYYGRDRKPVTYDDSLDKKWDIAVPDTIMDGTIKDMCSGR
jgi:hypothetical protein